MAEDLPRRGDFRGAYDGRPPWDLDGPQPAFAGAAERVSGEVLDAGCGTGEHALFFAARGLGVTGVDFMEKAVRIARDKAVARGLAAEFLVKDALELAGWDRRFDTVLDSGLFHVFGDAERARYLAGLRTVLRPGGRLLLLCFSDATPGTQGPRRVGEAELRTAFRDGWTVEDLATARFTVRPEARAGAFGGEDPRAWFLIARRAIPSGTSWS